MSKSQNLSENSRNKRMVLIVFNGALYHVCTYTVTVALHESGTRSTISWSVTMMYITKYSSRISVGENEMTNETTAFGRWILG